MVSLSPFLSPAALISGDSTGQSQARVSEGEGGRDGRGRFAVERDRAWVCVTIVPKGREMIKEFPHRISQIATRSKGERERARSRIVGLGIPPGH